jgi:acetamidase/formamidase
MTIPRVFAILSLCAVPALSQVTGNWLVTAEYFGTPGYFRIELTQEGDKVTGKLAGTKLTEVSVNGNSIHLVATQKDGSTRVADATLADGKLTGKGTDTFVDDKAHPIPYTFTAIRVPARPTGPPQRHEFKATVFYREFSPFNKPVLTIAPGDTVHTTTVDAGGADGDGVRRSRGGNPETGPFYIESAMPGDTLVVHLVHLRLNRDYAVSDDSIVESGLDSDLAVKMKGVGKEVRWHLDLAKGVATPENPSEHLKHYTVPLKPMLGCVATAPGPGGAPPPTGDSGNWGGNMDFNEIAEGSTIYLPVANPGALLYVGDGHAAQGDGELNGNALETSMDVEFTVDVISGKRLQARRVETPSHIIAMGYAGSLDDAFRWATSNMAQWLTDDYKLTPSEIGQVLGTAAEYKVSEVADRNSGVVLKISKDRLTGLGQ